MKVEIETKENLEVARLDAEAFHRLHSNAFIAVQVDRQRIGERSSHITRKIKDPGSISAKRILEEVAEHLSRTILSKASLRRILTTRQKAAVAEHLLELLSKIHSRYLSQQAEEITEELFYIPCSISILIFFDNCVLRYEVQSRSAIGIDEFGVRFCREAGPFSLDWLPLRSNMAFMVASSFGSNSHGANRVPTDQLFDDVEPSMDPDGHRAAAPLVTERAYAALQKCAAIPSAPLLSVYDSVSIQQYCRLLSVIRVVPTADETATAKQEISAFDTVLPNASSLTNEDRIRILSYGTVIDGTETEDCKKLMDTWAAAGNQHDPRTVIGPILRDNHFAAASRPLFIVPLSGSNENETWFEPDRHQSATNHRLPYPAQQGWEWLDAPSCFRHESSRPVVVGAWRHRFLVLDESGFERLLRKFPDIATRFVQAIVANRLWFVPSIEGQMAFVRQCLTCPEGRVSMATKQLIEESGSYS